MAFMVQHIWSLMHVLGLTFVRDSEATGLAPVSFPKALLPQPYLEVQG